jgi:hypothetical protein
MKTFRFLLLIAISFFLWSCPGIFSSRDGEFIEKVIPLTAFNSEFDDYNSTLPMNKNGEGYLVFSSKREKKEYFNLVSFPVKIDNEDEDNPIVSDKSNYGSFYGSTVSNVPTFIKKSSGNYNVLGPFTANSNNLVSYGSNSSMYQFLFYADDTDKQLDIKAIYQNGNNEMVGPLKMSFLNSEKDDAYPFITYHGDKIYFCSNREGNFDIYEAIIGNRGTANQNTPIVEQLLNPKSPKIEKIDILSSKYDDKCPYLFPNEQLIVFASNRPGGFGGFDIYYSRKKDGVWAEPINAGSRINTNADEYRPIFISENSFNFPLMIFSSNRSGGKGGFDLYMTGLLKF